MRQLFTEVRGAGPAVILLHGQPGGLADWARVARLLEDRFRVISVDRPGYGRTGGTACGFRDNALAVVSLMDLLGLPSATMVGHSWAGGVAMALAEDFPRRVSGLVLVASVSPGEPLGRVDRLLAAPRIGSLVAAVTLNVASRLVSFRPLRSLLDRTLRGTNEESLMAMADSWRDGHAWRSFAIEQQALVDELPELWPGVGSIRPPTVVIVGNSDRIVPATAGARLAGAIPAARLLRVPGAGHLLPHDHPAVVANAISDVARLSSE